MHCLAKPEKRGDGCYRFRITHNGQKYETYWYAPVGMSEKKADREASHQLELFKEEVRNGTADSKFNAKMTFQEYAEIWFKEYTPELELRTVQNYRDKMPRILEALGHLPLNEIKQLHIRQFLNNLAENGIKDNERYEITDQFRYRMAKKGWTMTKLSRMSGVSFGTIKRALNGYCVLPQTARKLSEAMNGNINTLFKQISEPEPLSKDTIITYRATISTILSSAVPDIIPFNPAMNLKLKKKNGKSEVEIVMEKKKFINSIDSTRLMVRALCRNLTRENMCLLLALMTGLRKGELAALRWEHIDFRDSVIYIISSRGNVKNIGVVEKATKTRSSERIVFINHWTLHLLSEYRERCREILKKNKRELQEKDYLFINERGKPVFPDTIYKWMKELLTQFGFPDLHPHSMRHTFASLNADILTRKNMVISNQMGHSSNITEKVYIHAYDVTKAQLAEEFGELIFGDKTFDDEAKQ